MNSTRTSYMAMDVLLSLLTVLLSVDSATDTWTPHYAMRTTDGIATT